MRSLALLLAVAALARGQDDCDPVEGVCAITMESLLEVSFYDALDDYGCQIECSSNPTCHFYSQFVDSYDQTLRKCLLYETCNLIETCDDDAEGCITYPEDPSECFPTGETCATDKDNVHDIFYFAVGDTFSCPQKCEDITACNFWSQFTINTFDESINKCFLFRDCQTTEPCIDCITGP